MEKVKILLSYKESTKLCEVELPLCEENIRKVAISLFDLNNPFLLQYFDNEWNEYIDFTNDVVGAKKFKIVPLIQEDFSTLILNSSNVITEPLMDLEPSCSSYVPKPKSSKWPQFDIDLCPLSPHVAKSLEEGKTLTWRDKSLLMHDISSFIRQYTLYPSSDQYTEVAQSLIEKYPYLAESVGTGFSGWKQKLRDQMKNMRRKETLEEVKEKKVKYGRKKSVCPTENEDLEELESAESLKNGSQPSVQVTEKGDDETEIIAQSFNERRQLIHKKIKIADLKEQYPLLFSKTQIENEFFRITGVAQLFSKIDEWLNENACHIIQFIDSKKSLQKDTEALRQTILAFSQQSSTTVLNEAENSPAAAGLLLPGLLQDKHSLFFDIAQNLPELEEAISSSITPKAIVLGNIFERHSATITVAAEGIKVYTATSVSEGLGIVTHQRDGRVRIADLEGEWRSLVRHYGLVALVVLVGLVFVVIMPMVGLFFCCCRCAGRCGARSQPFEKRYDPCRRHTHGFFLSCITIFIAFGVVCAFVTNEYLESGTRGLPNDVRTSILDTDLYLNNTKKEVNNLLINNYLELDTTLNTILHKSGEIMKEQLGEVSKAEVISNLTNIVQGLNIIRNDLTNIDRLSINLKDKAFELEQALRETRENLMAKLHQCRSHPACVEFLRNYNITHLNLETDFAQLPNVTASLQNVSALLESDIEQEVSKGQLEFEKVQQQIQQTVDEGKPLISDAIRRAGMELRQGAYKIDSMLDKAREIMHQESKEPLQVGEKYLREYGPYQHYLGLGVSCTLLIVLSCLTFGLFCGYCGKRPDGGYNDDCCDKGTGSRFLMLGVWVMFLTWAALMVITVFYFISGVLADRAVCYTLQHPESRLFHFLDQEFPLRIYGSPTRPIPPLRLSNIVKVSNVHRRCHRNESLYSVLELKHLVDISKYPDLPQQLGINKHIEELTGRIRLENHVDILTPSAQQQLIRLANSPLNQFNLTIYTSVLNEKITSIDLTALSQAIKDTANKLPREHLQVQTSLVFQAQYLELHQQNQVSTMLRLVQELNDNANNLTEHLRFNEPSLKLAVEKMLRQVEVAQNLLNKQGPQIISKIAADFAAEFTVHITDYMNRVVSHTESTMGKCWPMSQVYNATITTACNKILDPYNGFWASVGVILVLFIPSIILSVKLAALYQKSDPYPGPLVEAEYLYDAYADRDNIPLANVNEKKKKKKQVGGARYAESYDNSGASGASGDRSRGANTTPGGPPGPDQRYADMAPKHWDFPNMGPPRYNSSPLSTEYERPPPYYYPGPSPNART